MPQSAGKPGESICHPHKAIYAAGSPHTYLLTFADNATPPNLFSNEVKVTVGNYHNIALPAPLYFDNFDSTPEGQLPTGWTEKSYTEITTPDFDLSGKKDVYVSFHSL